MLFREFAEALDDIEKTSSRLEMTEKLAKALSKMSPEEGYRASFLLLGKLAPDYEGVELGIGMKLLFEGLGIATGYPKREVEKLYKEVNEVGKLAEELTASKKQSSLFNKEMTLSYVYETLYRIAKASGEGSVDVKLKYCAELFNNATPLESRYIARILVGKLRVGIGEPTILDALSWVKTGGKELRESIERAYNICSDIGLVVKTFLEDPEAIKEFKIEVFRPLRPALAERLASAEEIFKKLGKCAVEYKYDGFRMQIHKKGSEVRIFSRRLERMEHMFPDIVEDVKRLDAKEMIFEGEALAFNKKEGRFFSFQETMHRRRKYGIEKASKDWPLKVYVFDLMFLDGKDLTDKEFAERRQEIEKRFPAGNLERSHLEIAESAEDIERVFKDALSKRLEGIMAKDLHAPYRAGKRGFAWIKLKKSYGEAIDTIDGVVVGYYLGTGARARFGFGGLLIAVYDEDDGTFKTIAKVGSGFTEEEMEKFKRMLSEIEVERPDKRVETLIDADRWVEPKYVVEVLYDEITRSPFHTAGREGEKGFALRFPRFLRLREDRDIYSITTVKEIRELYEAQEGAHK